jgi:hypothetical protein
MKDRLSILFVGIDVGARTKQCRDSGNFDEKQSSDNYGRPRINIVPLGAYGSTPVR